MKIVREKGASKHGSRHFINFLRETGLSEKNLESKNNVGNVCVRQMAVM